ncbi:hypothetical protein JYT29_00145 [Nitrospina gracilis]|nr:hypothetical protein [Nitrospina gracilis]
MIKAGLKIISFFTAIILISGCTHIHKVAIAPEIIVHHANVSTSKTVGVKVVDLRSDKKFYSKNRFGLNDVSIVASSDLADTVRDKVVQVLGLLNFRPNSFDVPTSHRLKLEILSAQLKVFGKGSQFKHEMHVVLRALCEKKGDDYKKTYHAKVKNQHGIPTHIGKLFSEDLINAGISKALQKVFDDKNFLTFLAE